MTVGHTPLRILSVSCAVGGCTPALVLGRGGGYIPVLGPDWGTPSPIPLPLEEDLGPEAGVPHQKMIWDQRLGYCVQKGPETRGWKRDLEPETRVPPERTWDQRLEKGPGTGDCGTPTPPPPVAGQKDRHI